MLEFQDEGNNITALPMQVLADSLPDLQVTRSRAPSRSQRTKLSPSHGPSPIRLLHRPFPGQTIWNDLVYLSVDQYLDMNSDIYLGTVKHKGALAGDGDPVNDQYIVNDTLQLPRASPGRTT